MNKQRIELANDWNQLNANFLDLCKEHVIIKNKLADNTIYYSNDKDDIKKSQLILAFSQKPINTYLTKGNSLQVEFEWGCRLFYTFEYNGSIKCSIRDFDDKEYAFSSYRSASKITQKIFNRNANAFLLVAHCTSKTTQPTYFEKIKFNLFKIKCKTTSLQLFHAVIKSIPIIKKIYAVIDPSDKNNNNK